MFLSHPPCFFILQECCCLLLNGTTCTGVAIEPHWRSHTSTRRTRGCTPCVSPPSLDMKPTHLTSLSKVGTPSLKVILTATFHMQKHLTTNWVSFFSLATQCSLNVVDQKTYPDVAPILTPRLTLWALTLTHLRPCWPLFKSHLHAYLENVSKPLILYKCYVAKIFPHRHFHSYQSTQV